MARSAHFAKLADLKTSLDRLLVLAGVVVHLLAVGTSQFDKCVLGHIVSWSRRSDLNR